MKNTLSLLFVTLLCVHLAHCDLRFVFSMFRHGARQPTAIHGGIDEFGELWDGPGELTAAGKRMHFLLGLRNRQVYKDFTTFSRLEGSVYVRSTDYNRTIESVESQMQGFFPPGTGEKIANLKTRALAHPFIDDPKGKKLVYLQQMVRNEIYERKSFNCTHSSFQQRRSNESNVLPSLYLQTLLCHVQSKHC